MLDKNIHTINVQKMLSYKKIFILLLLLFLANTALAKTTDLIIVTATVTENQINFSPEIIPENVPFVIHVINQAGVPIELENADTSVEVYSGTDKTFKVGLAAGNYVFFNDFNARTKTATLAVKPAGAITTTAQPVQSQSTPALTHTNMAGILFVVWRESVEALLVVGIVYSWLSLSNKAHRRSGLVCLAAGVVIGLACAVVLSFLLVKFNETLSSDAANAFQAVMTLLAVAMIVYMVKWMRANGRTLKTNMHQTLEKNSSTFFRNIAILTVVALSVAREGSEASIFIYALGLGNQTPLSMKMIGVLGLGVGLAIATIFLLQLGNKVFSWRFFFKVTEILLLLLGGGLLLNALDKLILSGFLIPLHNKIWDTSFLISDGGFFSPILSSFMGYRAAPSLMCVIGYGLYWLIVYYLMKKRPTYAK